eukprot:1257669-Prymnesium_polylepis.1
MLLCLAPRRVRLAVGLDVGVEPVGVRHVHRPPDVQRQRLRLDRVDVVRAEPKGRCSRSPARWRRTRSRPRRGPSARRPRRVGGVAAGVRTHLVGALAGRRADDVGQPRVLRLPGLRQLGEVRHARLRRMVEPRHAEEAVERRRWPCVAADLLQALH